MQLEHRQCTRTDDEASFVASKWVELPGHLATCMLLLQEKAAKLHEQLHGSTFHMKLAKEAMKKVRQAEVEALAREAAAKDALEAEVVKGNALLLSRRTMLPGKCSLQLCQERKARLCY